MNRNTVYAALWSANLAACSHTSINDPAAFEESRQNLIKVRTENMQEHLEKVPEWALTSPRPDSDGVYAVGISSSTDVNLALKKSRLEAEFGLAKQFSQELSGVERSYSKDQDDYQTDSYTSTVYKLVKRVPISGYSIEKQEIVVSDGKYNSYVLLRLSNAQFSSLLRQQKSKETSDEIRNSYSDLEKRITQIESNKNTISIPTPIPDATLLSKGI